MITIRTMLWCVWVFFFFHLCMSCFHCDIQSPCCFLIVSHSWLWFRLEPQASSRHRLITDSFPGSACTAAGHWRLPPAARWLWLRGRTNWAAASLSQGWQAERCSRYTDQPSFSRRGCGSRPEEKLWCPTFQRKNSKCIKHLQHFFELKWLISNEMDKKNMIWLQLTGSKVLFLWFCSCLTLIPTISFKPEKIFSYPVFYFSLPVVSTGSGIKRTSCHLQKT